MAKELHKVAKTFDVKPGMFKVVQVEKEEIVLCNVDGDFFAIDDICTHDGGSLHQGCLSGDIIECPRHGARFNIRTGQVVELPALYPIATYEVKIQGDDILVAVDSA